MSNKKINEFLERTVIADDDLVPFWDTSEGKTCQITFSDFMKSINKSISDNGIIAKISGGNYFRFKPDTNGTWQMVEDLGSTYP